MADKKLRDFICKQKNRQGIQSELLTEDIQLSLFVYFEKLKDCRGNDDLLAPISRLLVDCYAKECEKLTLLYLPSYLDTW